MKSGWGGASGVCSTWTTPTALVAPRTSTAAACGADPERIGPDGALADADAQLWGTSPDRPALAEALDRLWAAAYLRTELAELFDPPAGAHRPPGAPLRPFGRGESARVPLGLHGRYCRAEIFAAFGLINDTRTPRP